MLHKRGKVEIAKDIFRTAFDGFSNLAGLIYIMCNLLHLLGQNTVVAWIRDRPVEAWKYLRRIAGDEPGEVLGEDFHAVFIDELNKASHQHMFEMS